MTRLALSHGEGCKSIQTDVSCPFYSVVSHLVDAMPPIRASSATGSGRGMSTYCRSLSSMSDPRCSGCTNSAVRDRYSFSVNSKNEESTAMGTSCSQKMAEFMDLLTSALTEKVLDLHTRATASLMQTWRV